MLIIKWRVEHWKQNTHETVTDTLIHMQTIDLWWIMFYRKTLNLVFLFSFVSRHALFLNGFFGFFSNFSLITDGNLFDVSHNWIFCFLISKSDFKTYFFFSSRFGCHFLFDSIDSLRMNFCLRRLFWKYTLEWWINFFSFAYTYDGFEWFLSVCPWWCGRGAYLHSTMLIKWIWFDRIN